MKTDLGLLKNLTILYAEDDEVIRESITRVLERFFGTVLVANDGIEALDIYEKNPVNVLLLDYVMPVISGYDVAVKVREEDRNLPIIIASAYTDKEKLMNAIPLGLIEYIEKPILYEHLEKTFKTVIKILKENNCLDIKLNNRLNYNFINKVVTTSDDKEIQLTKKEYEFIELLLKKKNQIVNKSVIEQIVFEKVVEENTLRNMVYRLRKKLECQNTIVTVKDIGYTINIEC